MAPRPFKSRLHRLHHAAGGRCYYCEALTWLPDSTNALLGPLALKATKDHVIALSRGGTNHPMNLVLACHDCNGKKGNRPIQEFLQDVVTPETPRSQLHMLASLLVALEDTPEVRNAE